MKPIYGLMSSLIVVAVGVVWLFVTPEPDGLTGMAHPEFLGMRVGGDADPVTLLPAHFIQIGTLCAMSFLMFMALPEARRSGAAVLLFVVAALLSILVWVSITVFHDLSEDARQPLYLLGFPLASSIAVYGVWLIGLLFSGFYVFGFNRWVFSDQDQMKFDALVAKHCREADEKKS